MSGLQRRKPWWYVLSLMALAGLMLGSAPVQAAPPRPPAPAEPPDPSAMVGQVGPTVVDVNTQMGYQSATGAGTGIVLDPNGVVLTNNHVISGATDIKAVSIGNGQTYDVDVVGFDRNHDVAVLQLRGAAGLIPANIGSSAGLAVGDPVVALGNAGGQGGTPSAVPGEVTALNQTVSASDELTGSTETLSNLIKASTPIRPGDSGGPLVNAAGQVIGLNTAASQNFQFLQQRGDGFAIPIDQAMSIAGQIRSGAGSPTVHIGDTAFLGVGVVDSNGAGAKVVQIIPDAPAAQGGLSEDDVITAVDGTPVDSPTALTNLLDQHHPGDTIELTWRGPSSGDQTGKVTLAPGPAG
jgi:S1-C subfamily serine protease